MKTIIIPIILSLCVSPASAQEKIRFDQDTAFMHLEKQCSFGPRVPGTQAHIQCRDYIVAHLKKYTSHVRMQPFMFTNHKTGRTMMLHNIIAEFNPGQSRRIILCAHWDSRPWADMDPDRKNHNKGVPGANDGASGTAVLLEMARILGTIPPRVTVELVFFDGEDAGLYTRNDTWCQGSKSYAGTLTFPLPDYAVLLDFVGDKDLHFPVEALSQRYAPDIVDKVWSKAEELGLHPFDRDTGPEVLDDHLSLIEAGVPAVNIIDFEYPYYHTIEDTPDKCSPQSLGIVGTLLRHLVYEE